MSYMVRRTNEVKQSWTGPIRSEVQAGKEAAAWKSVGWSAEVVENTPEVKREVRMWLNSKKGRAAVIEFSDTLSLTIPVRTPCLYCDLSKSLNSAGLCEQCETERLSLDEEE